MYIYQVYDVYLSCRPWYGIVFIVYVLINSDLRNNIYTHYIMLNYTKIYLIYNLLI